jgi:hypothetical protein
VAAVALLGAALLLWAPSLIASRYSFAARPTDFLSRPDKGWDFLYQVVTQSRGVHFGSSAAAEELARVDLWAGPPARATSVRLVYVEGPFTVPVPPGGYRPGPADRVARPPGSLAWVVYGRVTGRRTTQMIGLLDYRTRGRPAWDIRRSLRRERAS